MTLGVLAGQGRQISDGEKEEKRRQATVHKLVHRSLLFLCSATNLQKELEHVNKQL
mgnify:CR=1 FL=1